MTAKLSRGAWATLAGLALTVILFVLAWAFPAFPGDEWALLKFQGFQTGWLNSVGVAVSELGRIPVAPALIGAVILGLAALRRWKNALLVIIALVPIGAGNALKLVVDRPRPEYLIAGPIPQGLSFPSGHSVYAAVFGGVLILLVEELVGPWRLRRGIQAALLLVILAIGASRVYLGVHWPSDVIGGFLFGGMSLLGLTWVRRRLLN